MTGELGKASLDLEANLSPFERNILAGQKTADGMRSSLDAVAAIANIAEKALNDVKMTPGQAAESKASAEGILSGVRGISDDARTAARDLDRVRLTEAQAAESKLAADEMSSGLNQVSRNADQAKRKLAEVRLAGGRNGAGVGPFGSGFGRVGLLGAGIGTGVLTGPAAAPAAAGLLAAIPTLAAGGVGVIGTLALAFDGVAKAIGGDKKAFDDLQPSAQAFVKTVRSLDGWFEKLRQTAGAGLFPGLTAGLKSALSPGTVRAITVAVGELARALGAAGAAWGKYLGSPQFQHVFGPLMAAAASNVRVLSDALLHVFDAFGVLGRAAIPFTAWLMSSIDAGARLADTWIRTKSATGQLGHAMDEAKTSLQLVAGLALSLLRVVGALGKALYPVSKIAVKDLTDGLDALAKIISRNKQTIREIVGGALAALVAAVKILTPLVGGLFRALQAIVREMGGWKGAFELVISGFLASKFLTLGKRIAGVGSASGTAAGEARGLRGVLLSLSGTGVMGGLSLLAGRLAGIVKIASFFGAELAALPDMLKVLAGGNPFDTGQSKSTLSTAAQSLVYGRNGQYSQKLHDLTTGQRDSQLASQYGYATVYDAIKAQASGKGMSIQKFNEFTQALFKQDPTLAREALGRAASRLDFATSVGSAAGETAASPGRNRESGATAAAKKVAQLVPGTHAWYMKYLGFDPFGSDPAFTKNLGPKGATAPVIPPAASHDLSLASANASRASVLGNVGAAATRYLNAELGDLNAAAKLIRTKYESATGKARTELFSALTRVQNTIRSVREKLAKASVSDQGARLKLAVETAKLAVENATVGSAAYRKAERGEEKALRAEISYLDKRAKNAKLSLAKRTAATRAEITDKKQLAALLKKTAATSGDAAKNEAQFLASFADIVSKDAPNAFPLDGGKTDTHLYDLKTEARQTNKHLKDIATRTRFPSSAYTSATAAAVTG
jgi:hypothetical protein